MIMGAQHRKVHFILFKLRFQAVVNLTETFATYDLVL